MIPIAVVVLLIVVVFSVAVAVSASNASVFDLSIFGAQIPVNATGLYFTGAGAMLVLALGVLLLRIGVSRARAKRAKFRQLQSAAGRGAVSRKSPVGKQSGGRAQTAAAVPARAAARPVSDVFEDDRGSRAEEPLTDRRPEPVSVSPVTADPSPSPAGTDGDRGLVPTDSAPSHPALRRLSSIDSEDDLRSPGSRLVTDRAGDDRRKSPTLGGPTTAAERQALLDEAEELTGDQPDR